MSEIASVGTGPLRDSRFAPMVQALESATQVALREMANTDVSPAVVARSVTRDAAQEIEVFVPLQAPRANRIILAFPAHTAATLTRRIMADTPANLDDGLVRDCVAELGNVIAGQAKAILTDTPDQFTFSIPQIATGAPPAVDADTGHEWIVARFESDAGPFTIMLCVRP
jgi:CheY-specific phosphatase CheX